VLVHQEAGARLSGVMGKGKGEAWAPATLFIPHIVILSRLDVHSLVAKLPTKSMRSCTAIKLERH
jgi:hypothetical protein